MTPESKLQKLQDILKIVDESVTREEFTEAFKSVIKQVLDLEKKSLARVDEKTFGVIEKLTNDFKNLTSVSQEDLSNFKASVLMSIEQLVTEQQQGLNFLKDKVRSLRNGKDGKDGKDGATGKNGSPDTPIQVRDKLESLTGDERIDKSAIKGLDDLDKRFASVGGGGTSTIGVQHVLSKIMKHQKFSTSSATTSSTLSNKVAGGVCIWVRYNGQMLHYGDQYTVSGTTISYTFTLDDDSIVEVTYITG